MDVRAERLLLKYKVPFVWNPPGKRATWNGSDLSVRPASDLLGWVCHEVAHFLMSTKLEFPEHGLGADPAGDRVYTDPLYDFNASQFEETLALLAGFALLLRSGTLEECQQHCHKYGIYTIDFSEILNAWPVVAERCPKVGSLITPLQLHKEIVSAGNSPRPLLS